jgi:hypothetical protein
MPKKRNPAPAELDDEYWTTQDGRRIAVGEMDVEHLRNVLRMILRNRRREAAKLISTQYDDDFAFLDVDGQDELNAQAYRDLANPDVYFPLLGVHGSPELQKKHGGKL